MTTDARLPLTRYRAVAACYVLETADNVFLVKGADALLDAGIYTWHVGELATSSQPPVRDVRRLFERSLKELGLSLPSPEEAARILARWHLSGVIERREPPFQAAFRLRDELSYPLRWDRRLSQLEPRLRFISLWDSYDTLQYEVEAGFVSRDEAEREQTELDREFLEQARSWISQEGPRLLDLSWLSWNGGIVPKLAQAIANEQDWDRLPILADALEEAGCNNPEILEHCRAGEPHTECCWIIDSLVVQTSQAATPR